MPPKRYSWEDDHIFFALVTKGGDPSSYKEAIEVDDINKWTTSMEQEMKFLERNLT